MRTQKTGYYPYNLCNLSKYTRSGVELRNYIRMLWEQHITWTRLAIQSLVFELPNQEFVLNRLLRNPQDFKQVFSMLYDERIADMFYDLLSEHLTIAADLIKEAKAGDTEKVDEIEQKWQENANEIALFFAYINPYWALEDWRQMFRDHLRLTKDEAVQTITGDYQTEITGYDELEKQALEMADLMTEGIICQFPNRFQY